VKGKPIEDKDSNATTVFLCLWENEALEADFHYSVPVTFWREAVLEYWSSQTRNPICYYASL
jgi:hypothetical protein